jgi:large conductance mechanosensitive channel
MPRAEKGASMFKAFKEFAMRGNVIDLAVGVIIGAAFGKVVSSLVQDILMPPIGLALKHVDFAGLFVALDGKHYDSLEAARKASAPTINYGLFLNNIVDFLIVAFCVFLLVQQVNRWTRKPQPAAAPNTKECPQCTMTIPIGAKRCPQCTAQIA